jgi:hypothetical protein
MKNEENLEQKHTPQRQCVAYRPSVQKFSADSDPDPYPKAIYHTFPHPASRTVSAYLYAPYTLHLNIRDPIPSS